MSNIEVFSYVRAQQLSTTLLEQQLGLFGKVYRRSPTDVVRKVVFQPDSHELLMDDKCRRRGRPKLSWAVELRKIAIQLSGSTEKLLALMGNVSSWKGVVKKFC